LNWFSLLKQLIIYYDRHNIGEICRKGENKMTIKLQKFIKEATLEGSVYGFVFWHEQDVTCSFSTYGLQHSRMKYNIYTNYQIMFHNDVNIDEGKTLRSCRLETIDERIEPETDRFAGLDTFDVYSLPLHLPKLSKENIKKVALKTALEDVHKFLLPIEVDMFTKQAIEALVCLNSNRLQALPRG
jgi:hypothetical protein